MGRDYFTSRVEVYIPEYYDILAGTESLDKCMKMVQSEKTIVVYDFDGPKDQDGVNECLLVTADMLNERLENMRHPFGHGYIVAAALAGIEYYPNSGWR